jgi:hypothetical protein
MKAVLRGAKIAEALARPDTRIRHRARRLVDIMKNQCWPGKLAAHARRHCWSR